MAQEPMRNQVESYIVDLQQRIVTAFESLDPSSPPFKRDKWSRPEGGWGQSCVFALPHHSSPSYTALNLPSDHVSVLEKAGVNISVIQGTLPPAAVKQMRVEHGSLPENPEGGLPFFAAGLSLVVHPRNPHAPTVHCNYRYFEVSSSSSGKNKEDVIAWWFGGGSDLTPSYLYKDDAIHFHRTIKQACDGHGDASLYATFKKWCDEYFWIPHRSEARGLGGIFFDDLTDGPHARLPSEAKRPRKRDDIFAFIKSLGDAFVPSYVPILTRRISLPWTEHERRWQLLRRGRYVEFNLVYDRGTKFGLMTPGARIESILMSLPEEARWEYQCPIGTEDQEAEGDHREKEVLEALRKPRDWLADEQQ